MIDPPDDELVKSVYGSLLAYRSRKNKIIAVNSALIGAYGSILAAGGGDSTNINDLIREMSDGI